MFVSLYMYACVIGLGRLCQALLLLLVLVVRGDETRLRESEA